MKNEEIVFNDLAKSLFSVVITTGDNGKFFSLKYVKKHISNIRFLLKNKDVSHYIKEFFGKGFVTINGETYYNHAYSNTSKNYKKVQTIAVKENWDRW